MMSKKMNEYARELPHYDDIPKSVLGALAFSFAMRLEEDDVDKAKTLLITEWAILYQGGIVPQPVPSKLHSMVDWEVFQPEVNE